jgi:hypothetical protein
VALHPSRLIALGVGKGTRALLRRSGRGGTSLPGLVAQHIDPRLAGELAQGISNGSLLVTGTNGKTTSTRMIAAALRGVGLLPITNREGSNMLRGVTTALLTEASWRGGLPDAGNRIGLFEVDEGHLPRVIAELAPRSSTPTSRSWPVSGSPSRTRCFTTDWRTCAGDGRSCSTAPTRAAVRAA